MHPLARPNNGTSISKSPGVIGLRAGDRIVLQDGRRGTADEFLQDGDAYVSLDDGTCATVRWQQMQPETSPPVEVTVEEDLRWPQDFKYDSGQYVRTREPYE